MTLVARVLEVIVAEKPEKNIFKVYLKIITHLYQQFFRFLVSDNKNLIKICMIS